MIWEELDQSLITLGLEASTNDEVLTKMGSLLTTSGFGKASYVEALIEREREYPTGLNIDGVGVAIPHTSVEHVERQAISIAVLAKPVTFEEMGMPEGTTVNVSLVFMLCVTDPAAHLQDLQRIVAILQDKSVLEKVLVAKTSQEVIEIIKEKESVL